MSITHPTTSTKIARSRQTAIMQQVPAPVAEERAQAQVVANGAAAAALLAAGIGSAAFGVFVVLSEASESFHDLMTLDGSVGPLSGKTTYAVGLWLAIWGLLHLALRRREVKLGRVAVAAGLLVAIALLCTFPPFYMLFAAE